MSRSKPGFRLAALPFLALHLALAAGLAVWAGSRARALERQRALPAPLARPLELAPLNTDPEMLSDAELTRVLARLKLPAAGPPPVALVDHELRLWGPAARFDDPSVLSGEAMRQLLTHHGRFARVYGRERPPLLVDTGAGVRFRTQQGPASSSHVDHTLATLLEVGTPLDHPVVTPERSTDVGALVAGSLREFSLHQLEAEWSILAYALTLPSGARWRTAEGQEVTLARMAERLMRQRLPEGVCSATHRVYALNALLRVGDPADGETATSLDPASAERSRAWLRDVTDALVAHQHPDGFWNDGWPYAPPSSAQPGGEPGDSLADRLVVTGHVLEWWAVAPPQLLPPAAVSRAAGRWLARTVESLSPEELADNLSYLTHAGRALALWRGVPAAAWLARSAGPTAPAGGPAGSPRGAAARLTNPDQL